MIDFICCNCSKSLFLYLKLVKWHSNCIKVSTKLIRLITINVISARDFKKTATKQIKTLNYRIIEIENNDKFRYNKL